MTRFSLRAAAILLIAIAAAGCGFVLMGAPRLVAPADGTTFPCFAVDTDPATGYVFTWAAVPSATGYVLEIYNIATGVLAAGATITGAPPATSFAVQESPGLCGASYRWRVGATFGGSTSAQFSGYWTFTINP